MIKLECLRQSGANQNNREPVLGSEMGEVVVLLLRAIHLFSQDVV